MTAPLRHAPAAERNGEAVLAALLDELVELDAIGVTGVTGVTGPTADGTATGPLVLELGSGTGQHVCRFARALPDVRFQPTEYPSNTGDLVERLRREGPPNVLAPLALDVRSHPWEVPRASLCLASNVVHMMEDDAVEGLVRGAAERLAGDGRLCLYGPFAIDGAHTGEGNRAFDAALRERAPGTGVRDLAWLDEIARAAGLRPTRRRLMPSDNRFVVWSRTPRPAERRGATPRQTQASSAARTPRA